MSEWFVIPADAATRVFDVAVRLVVATVLGGIVAWIHRRTRMPDEASGSFTVTLVMLSILIAMVTQVVGDNVARAFSLVGALSIVRFRTVVRDTQDTAYVIFAVVIGMAIGAGNGVVAACGLVVVGIAAFVMRSRGDRAATALPPEATPFELSVRMAIGVDAETAVGTTLDRFGIRRQLVGVATARQGLSMDVTYRAAVGDAGHVPQIVGALNAVDGVQSVTLQRADVEEMNDSRGEQR